MNPTAFKLLSLQTVEFADKGPLHVAAVVRDVTICFVLDTKFYRIVDLQYWARGKVAEGDSLKEYLLVSV